MPSVLIVEDDLNSAEMLASMCEAQGFACALANDLADARQQLLVHEPDVVLLDLYLPDGSGLELFSDAAVRGKVEVVLITGDASIETSVQALRLGASDYLIKPIGGEMLARALRRALDAVPAPGQAPEAPPEPEAPAPARNGGRRRTRAKASDPESLEGLVDMVGRSRAMRWVYRQILKVAPTSVSVLITGESGTGKELVAQAVHAMSRRRSETFKAVNCGAISAQLIESELFGHEKGSFTGAIRQHRGVFEQADGGTLFLDEITEMPIDLQVRLLRVLETGMFSRVGSDSLLSADVRVIAASNRDPMRAVAEGKLREDLYYRLNVFQIALPALRDRLEDVPEIAAHFLDEINAREGTRLSFDGEAMEALGAYHWPGNVRELRNVINRAAILAEGDVITADRVTLGAPPVRAAAPPTVAPPAKVPEKAGPTDSGDAQLSIPLGTSLAEAERLLIEATLAFAGGSHKRCAEMLGISALALERRLRDLESAD